MSCNYNYNCNCNNSQSNTTSSQCSSSTTNCCKGLSIPRFSVAKAQTICAYVNRIFDEQVGTGTALFGTLSTTLPSHSVTTILTNPNTACCQPCQIGAGTSFTTNNCTTSQLLTLTPTTAITASQILINGVTVPNLTTNTDGTYTISVGTNNRIPSAYCTLPNLGTPSTLMIQSAGPWQYTAQHDLYGTMNYNGQSCNFHVTVNNIDPSTIPNNATSTLMIQSLCIPTTSSTINLSLNGSLSLISPVLTYDTVTSSVQVTGSEVIVPKITAEVLQPTKVCFQAMM